LAITVSTVYTTGDKAVVAANITTVTVIWTVTVVAVALVIVLKVCFAIESAHSWRTWALIRSD
jgi:outer membrane protein assembly factor BamB